MCTQLLFSRIHPASRLYIHISAAITTSLSHKGALDYTGPTSQQLVSVYNHFGVSPILPKNLASRPLRPSSLGDPPLSRSSSYLHRRRAAGFLSSSASRCNLLDTLLAPCRSPPHRQKRSFIVHHRLQRQLLSIFYFAAIWSSFSLKATVYTPPKLIFVICRHTYTRVLAYRIHKRSDLVVSHSFGTLSQNVFLYDVKLLAWNVLGTL